MKRYAVIKYQPKSHTHQTHNFGWMLRVYNHRGLEVELTEQWTEKKDAIASATAHLRDGEFKYVDSYDEDGRMFTRVMRHQTPDGKFFMTAERMRSKENEHG